MKRRHFLTTLGVAPVLLKAQQGPPRPERIESLTPAPKPAIALNHLGFLPGAKKTIVVRTSGGAAPREFTVRDVGSPVKPYPPLTRPLRSFACDFGDCMVGEFHDLDREAMYQASAGGERSVPFFIRRDAWRRTLPKAVSYIHSQRCGTEIANVHALCHMDDARRRDNGEHVDVTGGWHDAGDLRKWMSATMTLGFALMQLARDLGETWDLAGTGVAPLLDEMRWGNRYFLKMQDKDGLVWADTAGGLNGDNSDNHWTDNQNGTADDRYINPSKGGSNQAMFTALQGMVANVFRAADPKYSQTCLDAAVRCWNAAKRGGRTGELAFWTRAAIELHRATGDGTYASAAATLGGQLLALQNTGFTGSQKLVRGFWMAGQQPYVDPVYSATPALALLELAEAFPKHLDAPKWRDAVRLHLDEYVLPLTARNAYRIMPLGVFFKSPTPERYRPLAGDLTYRYFMPVRKQFWWLGTTSHLECYATALARASRVFDKLEYRDLAYRQIEWVMGANPFGSCLMTGEGIRNPYPHSRFVGLLIGGIMNGIAGNMNDEPVLDLENGMDWRTAEYWSPHNSYYIHALAALEKA